MIEVRYAVASQISPRTERVERAFATGPRNLLLAIALRDRLQTQLADRYGNLGYSDPRVTVDGVDLSSEDIDLLRAWDRDDEMRDARLGWAGRPRSRTERARDIIARTAA